MSLRHGPEVLLGYRADGSRDHDAIRTVGESEEIDGALRELVRPDR